MIDQTLPTPVELAFEPVNLCNAKCFCCPYTFLQEDKEYRGQKMSGPQIEELIGQFAAGLEKHKVPKMKATIQPWRYSDPLVCKDLELVFELAEKHDLKVIITTNAVSFSEKKCDIMKRYIKNLANINISIIGYNEKEIREYMDLDWNVTQARLRMVQKLYPELSQKMVIGVKNKIQHPTRKQYGPVIEKLQALTLGRVKKKVGWLENRLTYNKFEDDGVRMTINEDKFVQGCAMVHGKILRRLEVMVDGTAVLCCDDATKQTNFGNVFEIGIEGVWDRLREYHNMIYSKQYSDRKKNMICNTCSRAKFKWRDEHRAEFMSKTQEINSQYLPKTIKVS
jgi:uncharacterized Fe-S cluster-containing radical SAM superfamily protein